MQDKTQYENLPEEAHNAVHAARDAAQAVEVARELQTNRAATAAADRVSENIGDILQNRIEHVLAKGTEQDKSIILARVPYICQDIKNIGTSLTDIVKMMEQVKTDLKTKDEQTARDNDIKFVNQDQFMPVKMLVFGFAGAVLTGFVASLIYLAYHQIH